MFRPVKLDLQVWSPAEFGGKLTCLTLLLAPIGDWYVRPAVLGLAAIGLLFRDAWQSKWLWTALAILSAVRVISDWPMADNHAYLLVYWCVALSVACWVNDDEALARNGRLLIGLTFALAALQKWTAADYVNDVFFLSTFLLDSRFEDFAVLLTTVTYEQIDQARDYLEGDYRFQQAGPMPFALPQSLVVLARISTLWNLFEQTLIAIAFLVPPQWRISKVRHPLLLFFCFTTYAVAPVTSFGWLLLSMGVTELLPGDKTRAWYLAAFAMLLIYEEVPWALFLVDYFAAG